MTAASAVAVAATFVWLGMVPAISFPRGPAEVRRILLLARWG